MNRLIETFGAAHYKTDRMNLIWLDVKDLSDFWFETTINSFICNFRQAPMITDFREKISFERERAWQIQKKIDKKEAEEFFLFPPEEEKQIFQTIIKRLQGQINDEDYIKFLELLRYTTKSDAR